MTANIKNYPMSEDFLKDAWEWIQNTAKRESLKYILLYTTDNVIWGILSDTGEIHFSDDENAKAIFQNPKQKILEIYLFGATQQLKIWKNQDSFSGSIINDQEIPDLLPDDIPSYYDQTYMLWGNSTEEIKVSDETFTRFCENPRGFELKIPFQVETNGQCGIKVRHYLAEDQEGQVFVAFSRLVDLVRVK